MIPLEQLDLSDTILQALKSAGVQSVERLCAMTVSDVGMIIGGERRLERIKELRICLDKQGMDLRHSWDDPVGSPVTPSRRVLRAFFDRLDLAPRTQDKLKAFLFEAIDSKMLLRNIDPADHDKIVRLLDLFEESDRW